MKINRILQIALLIELFLGTLAGAQVTVAANTSLDPHLFLTLQDFETRKAIVQREPWAKAALTAIVREADGYPKDYLNRFGLTKVAAPEKTAQWAHWYVCSETGTHLEFHPPNHNICPDTGKDYQNWPISDVHYHVKVPFVIVRRKGKDAEFISLFIPSKGLPPSITATRGEDGSISVHGRIG